MAKQPYIIHHLNFSQQAVYILPDPIPFPHQVFGHDVYEYEFWIRRLNANWYVHNGDPAQLGFPFRVINHQGGNIIEEWEWWVQRLDGSIQVFNGDPEAGAGIGFPYSVNGRTIIEEPTDFDM